MSVSSTTTKVSYAGNGSTTTFAYTFKIFADADLEVIIRSSLGVETTQSLTTHYTVTGAGTDAGGNVVFVSAPASGETVVIRRTLTLTQGTDYVENDPFPADSHEDALDRLTFIAQGLQEELDRTLKYPVTDATLNSELTSSLVRANKYLGFDSTGAVVLDTTVGNWRGTWATSTAYVLNDVVSESGSSYICIEAHTSGGTFAGDSAKWNTVAAKGDTGATGAAGSVTSVATAGLATGGTITEAGTVTVSINGQTGLSASPVAADEFAIYDASATAHKKITTTELFGSDVLTASAREYTKTQNFNMTTLSDSANISWDLSQNQVAKVTLAGNRILDAPSNQVAGATYILIVVQDGTGSRTLDTSASAYKFPGGTEPTLSTGANAVDILTFVSDGSSMFGVAQLNFS